MIADLFGLVLLQLEWTCEVYRVWRISRTALLASEPEARPSSLGISCFITSPFAHAGCAYLGDDTLCQGFELCRVHLLGKELV